MQVILLKNTLLNSVIFGIVAGFVSGILFACWILIIDLIGGHVTDFVTGQVLDVQGYAIFLSLNLLISSFYGFVFGLIIYYLTIRMYNFIDTTTQLIVASTIFGIIVWVIASIVMYGYYNVGFDSFNMVAILIGHIIYGISLGMFFVLIKTLLSLE